MLIPSSENLALLGNLCSLDTIESRTTYNEFLYYCSSNYKNIYLIPGPWEMYSAKSQDYKICINNLYSIVNKSYSNVYILDKERNLRGRKEKKGYKEGYNTFKPAELSNEMLDDFKVILYEYRAALKKNRNATKQL
jgi:hypothetical protein